MIVEPPTPADVATVAEAMRERDRDEFMPLTHFATHGELITSMTARFGRHPDCFVVHGEPGPVAVGGMLLHRPNVATLLFFATDDFAPVGPAFTRFVVQRLFPGYIERGVHRIEATALHSYDETHRFLRALGLKEEATLTAFGRGREDYLQFAWVQ